MRTRFRQKKEGRNKDWLTENKKIAEKLCYSAVLLKLKGMTIFIYISRHV